MVDAARQMLDELMGRNRNLHPSEAVRKVKWDDPDFCQYYLVKFCPHDLFVNTRADLGPCTRIHDDEARELYEQAQPTQRKRQYEDEFLRFCNTMLNDVDRKIQKGRQRLLLMQRDQPMSAAQLHISKYNEQLNNLNARIKKLLTEAEEAGIRGDVDQAQDLMTLCEQLKDEKDALVAQHENSTAVIKDVSVPPPPIIAGTVTNVATNNTELVQQKSPSSNGEATSSGSDTVANAAATTDGGGGGAAGDKKVPAWMQDLGTLPEKQMEVCEVCGAFLIVGDAQQRIEDHLMGKQHLGYSRLRKAVEELHEKRLKEREEDERKRQDDREEHRSHRATSFSERNHFNDRRRDYQRDRYDYNRERGGRDYGGRSRDYGNHAADRHRHHHHKSSHRRRSHSRSHSHRSDHKDHSRSRSRSRSRSHSNSHSHSHNRY